MAKLTGFSVWLLFGASMAIFFFYLLVNVSLCQATEFCSTTVFFFVLIGSLVMIILLSILSHPVAQGVGKQSITLFFMRDWTLKKVLYIPLGILGVFGASFLGSAIQSPYSPYLSIGGAGIILLITLYRTNMIAIPIIIHGVYNSVVVWSQSSSPSSLIYVFSNLPITVPHLGITLGLYTGVANEILFQFFLVAVAEEVFKVFLIDYIIVGLKGKFDVKNSIRTWIAGIVSVAIWTAYHSITAIK